MYMCQYVNLTGGLILSLSLKLHLNDDASHIRTSFHLRLMFPYGLI